jgi:hypothetical protein
MSYRTITAKTPKKSIKYHASIFLDDFKCRHIYKQLDRDEWKKLIKHWF